MNKNSEFAVALILALLVGFLTFFSAGVYLSLGSFLITLLVVYQIIGNGTKNILSKFLCYCSGVNYEELERHAPLEISKYSSVGLTIVFTGIFAAFSGGYAISRIFAGGNVLLAIFLGLLWGGTIANIDRLIVMTMKKTSVWWMQILTALPRLVLAVFISLIIARPLEVRLFENRIKRQIIENELGKREQDARKILGISGKDRLEEAEKENTNELVVLNEKLNSDPNTKEFADLLKNLKEAEEKYNSKVPGYQNEISSLRKDINFIEKTKTEIVDGVEKPTKEAANQTWGWKQKIKNLEGQIGALNKARANARASVNDARSKYKDVLREKIDNANKELEKTKIDLIEADSTVKKLTNKSDEATNVAYTENFVTQLEALADLTKGSKTMENISIMIALLFLMIEITPIFVKLIQSATVVR